MPEIHIDISKVPKYDMDAFCADGLAAAHRLFERPDIWAQYEAWHLRKFGCPPKQGGPEQ